MQSAITGPGHCGPSDQCEGPAKCLNGSMAVGQVRALAGQRSPGRSLGAYMLARQSGHPGPCEH